MISNDKAFDMLPHAVEIFEKLDIQTYINEHKIEIDGDADRDALTQEQGMQLIKYVLRHASEVKEEVFNIVAIAEDMAVDEVREAGISTTITTFKNLLQDKELMGFFSQGTQ